MVSVRCPDLVHMLGVSGGAWEGRIRYLIIITIPPPTFRLVPLTTMSSEAQIFDCSGVPASKGNSEARVSTTFGRSGVVQVMSHGARLTRHSPVGCSWPRATRRQSSRIAMPMGITTTLLPVRKRKSRRGTAASATAHFQFHESLFSAFQFPWSLVFSAGAPGRPVAGAVSRMRHRDRELTVATMSSQIPPTVSSRYV
jgi:hypothetical protein